MTFASEHVCYFCLISRLESAQLYSPNQAVEEQNGPRKSEKGHQHDLS